MVFEMREGREDIFYDEGGEILEQFDQRSSGCPVTGSVQSQVAWGLEQLEDVSSHGRFA